MDKNRLYILWSLGAFFGWMLSFPFNGPVLFSISAVRNVSGAYLGFIFMAFHAIFLFLAHIIHRKGEHQKSIMILSASICIAISVLMWFLNESLWPAFMGIMGAASAFYVIEWSYFYTTGVAVTGRIKFMATIMIAANAIYYVLNVMSNKIPVGVLFLATLALLFSSLWLAYKVKNDSKISDVYQLTSKQPFPVMLVAVLCLLVFGLYINGGLMFSVIYPSFRQFENISIYYRYLPYIAGLLILWFFGEKLEKMFPVYMGTSLLGMAFVSFAILGSSVWCYFITETLIQGALAFLDLFLWTLLGDMAAIYGHTFRIFGYGLSSNVAGIFVGGLMGDSIFYSSAVRNTVTGMLAAGVIFITFLIIPWLDRHIQKHFTAKILCTSTVDENKKTEKCPIQPIRLLPNVELLTAREIEIAILLLKGYANKEISMELYISENTLKVHTRHIYQKIGVSNRKELLQLILDINHNNT